MRFDDDAIRALYDKASSSMRCFAPAPWRSYQPEYEAAIDKMFSFLKPQGRFAMIGMKTASRRPYKFLNPVMEWMCRCGAIDLSRDAAAYIRSKCDHVDYEECFGGFYYVLSASSSCFKG